MKPVLSIFAALLACAVWAKTLDGKVAYEQKPEAVKKWLAEEYPAISARAKTEKAEIHWADETAVMNTDVRGRSYSPRGTTPTTRAVWGSRQRFSIDSQ